MLETNFTYPLVVEVTLYKHNLIDNRVLSEIRRNARLTKVNNSDKHFFISTSDIVDILDSRFKDDILYQTSLSQEDLAQNVNSAFFLHSVVSTFSNLKYVKFSISDSKNYSRRKGNQVSFDYKILHAKIDLPSLVSDKKELRDIQALLKYIKFWQPNSFYPKTFVECTSRDLINQIQYHEGSKEEFVKEFGETITKLLQYIDIKLESDNSSLHLIVMH